MRVTSLQVQNFKGFVDSGPIEIGSTTILVGRNNAGKSSLIRALLWMQAFAYAPPVGDDVRVGTRSATATVNLQQIGPIEEWGNREAGSGTLTMRVSAAGVGPSLGLATKDAPQSRAVDQLPGVEPNHFIVPFLANRKPSAYQEDVSKSRSLQVGPDLSYLAAKLTRVVDSDFSGYPRYVAACKELVGSVIRPVSSGHGQLPGVYADDNQAQAIYIDSMGDGVPNIVGLIADLVLSRDKLFLIEEPETDLHPRALKVLLDLMAEATETNQIVVSTHSNIVLRHLGSLPNSVVQYVESDHLQRPPTATVRPIGAEPLERMEILQELGYELRDFDLWDAWLILEEASAERIIREYLIPWFVPQLRGRIRTVSTNGNANVEKTFEDFNRLVRFTHLEPAYTNRAWVLIDGDDEGQKILHRLRESYPTWEADRFSVLSMASFEMYYPERFAQQRQEALAEPNRRKQRAAKRELLLDVLEWIRQDPVIARPEFEQSALDVIVTLQKIEAQLDAMTAEQESGGGRSAVGS